ncbi:MAG: chromate resistance protein [Marinibacterium sp.]|nr:chromate resistance protein [Marinibacterium sp.]
MCRLCHNDRKRSRELIARSRTGDQKARSPKTTGLMALLVDPSHHCRDDHDQLAIGVTLYDALYRWARDRHREGHDWQADRT